MDMTKCNDCVCVYIKNKEVVQAGTTIYSMPIQEKNAEYQRFAEDYDIRFIFDDFNIFADFYAVPRVDIMAVDSCGGYIGTVGGATDIEGDLPICYIDGDKNVFYVAKNMKEFIGKRENWKKDITPCGDIEMFASKEAAENKYNFFDMTSLGWDSDLYLKFANERKQPCLDLLSRLDGEFENILDLGCGPGNSSQNLIEKYKNATVVGFDSDDNMLEKARSRHNNIQFVKGFAPDDFYKLNRKFDLVFSNACIHWIENQEELIKKVYGILNAKGTFAVQIPLTDESHFYRILYRLIDEKWTNLKTVKNFHNLTQEGYYNTLIKQFNKVSMWRSDYYHVVRKEMVIEWYKGSGLRPYLALLSEDKQEEFLEDLQTAIDREYPILDDGNVFLIMPRLFFIAEK